MTQPYRGNYRIASPYGTRVDPITGESGAWHGGLDLVGEDKTVVSVCAGTVLQSRMVTDPSNRTSEWGNYIAVQGEDSLVYYYCHLAGRHVSAGDRIAAGQILGIEGSTGRSTGSHLHFEVRQNGVQTDPAAILGIPNAAGYVFPQNPIPPENSVPSSWAADAVNWAVSAGILLGDGNGNLRLRDICTREEVLTMLYRIRQSTQN